MNAYFEMAWLGSTDNTRSVRKRIAEHISSSTNHGMALVTDSAGALASSSVTETELSTLSGSTSNIQAQLTDIVDNMASTLATSLTSYREKIDPVQMADVTALSDTI